MFLFVSLCIFAFCEYPICFLCFTLDHHNLNKNSRSFVAGSIIAAPTERMRRLCVHETAVGSSISLPFNLTELCSWQSGGISTPRVNTVSIRKDTKETYHACVHLSSHSEVSYSEGGKKCVGRQGYMSREALDPIPLARVDVAQKKSVMTVWCVGHERD
jgi:hypothetical protein